MRFTPCGCRTLDRVSFSWVLLFLGELFELTFCFLAPLPTHLFFNTKKHRGQQLRHEQHESPGEDDFDESRVADGTGIGAEPGGEKKERSGIMHTIEFRQGRMGTEVVRTQTQRV